MNKYYKYPLKDGKKACLTYNVWEVVEIKDDKILAMYKGTEGVFHTALIPWGKHKPVVFYTETFIQDNIPIDI